MKKYLTFRLYGPMASWGQAAVGGERPTGMQPTRSAVLGLLAAALGIKRDNEIALQALQIGVRIAIKQCVPSSLLRDYHTTQVPSQSKKIVHRTRKSELSEHKLNTILSSRDYRCDGLWVIGVALTEKASHTLEQIREALLKPVFSLYLGRKSCPLAVPLAPKLIDEAVDCFEALDNSFPPLTRSDAEDALWLANNGEATYFWESEEGIITDTTVVTTHPWDEPVSRRRWQFRQRIQYQTTKRA